MFMLIRTTSQCDDIDHLNMVTYACVNNTEDFYEITKCKYILFCVQVCPSNQLHGTTWNSNLNWIVSRSVKPRWRLRAGHSADKQSSKGHKDIVHFVWVKCVRVCVCVCIWRVWLQSSTTGQLSLPWSSHQFVQPPISSVSPCLPHPLWTALALNWPLPRTRFSRLKCMFHTYM